MKFIYTGEAPDGFIEQYGHVFKPGEVVEVTEPFAVKKLLGNRFFQAAPGAVDHVEPQVEVAPVRVKRGRRPTISLDPVEHVDHDEDDADTGGVRE